MRPITVLTLIITMVLGIAVDPAWGFQFQKSTISVSQVSVVGNSTNRTVSELLSRARKALNRSRKVLRKWENMIPPSLTPSCQYQDGNKNSVGGPTLRSRTSILIGFVQDVQNGIFFGLQLLPILYGMANIFLKRFWPYYHEYAEHFDRALLVLEELSACFAALLCWSATATLHNPLTYYP